MNTLQPKVMYEWNDIPWGELERDVFKLQKRIFQATRRGNVKTVHRLQHLLLKSKAATLLAVRRVTQDNRGKKTAGIDGITVLEERARLKLAQELMARPFLKEAQPVRRVWIPKPGKTEKRPLGIPTIADRARQALVKLVLEPEWEAKFEPHSYGFRPGRSAHDAIQAITESIRELPKYVLDADIAQCFDRINHKALLEKLRTFPVLQRTVQQWLKAGIMEEGKLFPSQEGTPQGGVISPLLANIALHGLETAIVKAFPARPRTNPSTGIRIGNRKLSWKPIVIRYADDFVILHQDRTALEQTRNIAKDWLRTMGLELKVEKTRITHSLKPEFGKPGFDFLGFNVRQYLKGKTHIRKGKKRVRNFWTFVKPSKNAIKTHLQDVSAILRSMRACSQADVIAAVNPKVSGWAQYHAITNLRSRSKVEHAMYLQLRRWSRRRHPGRSSVWINRKYWRLETGKWIFATPDGEAVLSNHQVRVKRNRSRVRGNGSIFDGDWPYWACRLSRYPGLTPTKIRLLKKQDGKCILCGLYFRANDDVMEIDHIIRTSRGGAIRLHNLQLLHAHCHHRKTARERAMGINDNDRIIEELDEAKVSRPVLKTSTSGD